MNEIQREDLYNSIMSEIACVIAKHLDLPVAYEKSYPGYNMVLSVEDATNAHN